MNKQPSQNPGGTEGEGEAQQHGTFRLDALGVAGSGFMIEAPPKRQVPVQALVLTALVLFAAGALYAMRQLGMGPMGAIAEVKIDYDYNKLKGDGADHKKLLEDLSTSQVDRQVPADQVQKNPFVLPVRESPKQREVAPPKKDTGPTPDELNRQKIEQCLKTLKVHTVLNGVVPVARIGDQNVRVGDTVCDGLLAVVAIYGRSVELKGLGEVYTLSIDDEVGGRQPGKRK